jgi:signal transduction histidine kinase
LRREETPDGIALALEAVRPVPVGEKGLFVIGGQWLDKDFLASLVLPAGMRALLYKNLGTEFSAENLTDASGSLVQAEKLAPLIEAILQSAHEQEHTIYWTQEPESAETFHALPLTGREGELLGVLLVGSSRRDLAVLQAQIRRLALGVGSAGLLLGFLLSWWMAARVSRPVQRLSEVVRQVAAGDWSARVAVRSEDEVGKLAHAFNHMTEQLVEQRRKLVQTERVAAWRELARRLAHELKNPLFPLQLTVENLRRAREQNSGQFDEVFRESTAALLAELENLKNIIARFSDFARMPAPRLQPVNVNELVRDVIRLHSPQFGAVGRPSISPELYLDEQVRFIEADPDLLRRALDNLVLNAMDAMPAGGTLIIRTRRENGAVSIEVSDTGTGLTREECERLFTPYYTTKQYGTGLGLAIVQSVVSDHEGKVFVESEPGQGTTFRLIFPEKHVGAKQSGGEAQAFAAASD